jgi:tryptophan synthase alpha subunit
MRIEEVFRRAGGQNRLVLLPEIIVGVPSIQTSTRAFDHLSSLENVVYKTATPVASGWPENTNDVIKAAHRTAISNGVDLTKTISAIGQHRPNVLTVYSEAIRDPFSEFLDSLEGHIDGIILAEGNEPWDKTIAKTGLTYRDCSELCLDRGIDFVPPVSGNNDVEEIREKVESAQGFVYLMISQEVGGDLYRKAKIQRMIGSIHEIRPVPVAVAFGIRGPEEFEIVRGLRGCGGAVMGTRIIEALSDGFREYTKLMQSIAPYISPIGGE